MSGVKLEVIPWRDDHQEIPDLASATLVRVTWWGHRVTYSRAEIVLDGTRGVEASPRWYNRILRRKRTRWEPRPYGAGDFLTVRLTGTSPNELSRYDDNELIDYSRSGTEATLIVRGVDIVYDSWDWPVPPAVAAPAAMPDHWPAWRMANWTREEWAEFERAVTVRRLATDCDYTP